MIRTLQELADFLRTIDNSPTSARGFDMQYEYCRSDATRHPCGNACCIGGWVVAVNKLGPHTTPEVAVASLAPDVDADFEGLCWPDVGSPAWNATPEQAAQAVENLIITGSPNWDEVMS